MITNFETITHDLTDEEKKLIPILIKGFKTHTIKNPIKAPEIVSALNSKDLGLEKKFTEVRLRKLCNFIRSNSLLPLCATSKGYFVSYDEEEIQNQIKSLRERADAIISCADGLMKFASKNNCIVCGGAVSWGSNGCPVANENDLLGSLFGNHKGMKHYDCILTD